MKQKPNNTLNLVFVCGIYFTLVEFKRPPPQQSGETPATDNNVASSPPVKIDPIALAQSFFADTAITPKIHIFNCPIFDLNDPEYPSFSPPWLLALKLALNLYRANINIIKNNLFPFPATSQLDDGDSIVERTNWANSQLMEWYNALPLGSRCSTPPPPDGDRLDFFESPLRHERTDEILPEVQESPGYQGPPAPLSGITTERVLLKRRRLKRG
ncbi:hypothetical protein BD779DRAFT_1230351 [Infundibulicybe gibba]|nr:hypothetical protein BD779DRAFT_1230351 [Infundibulicybe gibba]